MSLSDRATRLLRSPVLRRGRSLARRVLLRVHPRRLTARLHRWSRRFSAQSDRVRFPIAPTWELRDDRHDARSAAATGRPTQYAGTGARYATASGMTWTRPDVVSVVYVLTSSIVTYRIRSTASGRTAEPIATIAGSPEFGDFTAITTAMASGLVGVTSASGGRLGVMRTDADGAPILASLATIHVPGDGQVHGVAFAPDGRHLVFTTIDVGGGLRVVRIADDSDGGLELELTAVIENADAPIRPKGVRFSADGRHLLIAYGDNASPIPRRGGHGFVAVHEWDPASGTIGRRIDRSSARSGIECGEDLTLIADDTAVIVTDQFKDAVHIMRLDRVTGRLGEAQQVVSWSAGGLTMPHGCATSPDGSTVAVTNYGDGTVRFFDAASLIGLLQ